MDAVLKHVGGRVPVIVTTSHFSSSICAARSRQAQEAGAAMVMIMPPYHGATFRVPERGIFDFYRILDHDRDVDGVGHGAIEVENASFRDAERGAVIGRHDHYLRSARALRLAAARGPDASTATC